LGTSLQTLIAAAVADPEAPVADLPLLGEPERHQVVLEWNPLRTLRVTEGDGPCIQDLVRRQAARTPEAVAAVYGDRHLTYGELVWRAGALARRLRRLGVGPEVRVGVCLERSLETVVGLLGVLEAGGAYLPLDPTYPQERLAFMIEDGRIAALLTQPSLRDVLPPHALPVVDLRPEGGGAGRDVPRYPHHGATGENLAYVMYTSGSTGRPKGVCIPHRALHWFVTTLGYVEPGPADRVAQGSTHTFDAATFELFGALVNGARLVGIPKEVMISPRELAARLEEEGISVLYLTAALFMQTVSEAPAAFQPLRRLLVGGEAVDTAFFRRALESGPPERLLYLYGPTETTVFSSWYEVALDTLADRVSVGRPIADAPHYLLDAGLRPVPVGAFGEAYIAGGGLARGYLDRPDLTAERFVPSPFSGLVDEPGARMYWTGDLMRYRPDGNLEFGRRVDDQVKIRGFRIEPREIETVLLQHPQVAKALVIVREDAPGDKRLVAYVVAPDDQTPAAGALREFLRERLPDYMVPAAFVPLAALPLFPHGKVDRRALPAPPTADVAPEAGESFATPRTMTEELLAGIWAEVLGMEKVGLRDDFFELGGHSLLATQVVSRLRSVFQIELPLRELFEEPTVAGLAIRVDRAIRAGAGLLAPPLVPVARQGALPLSFAQQRLWFLDQLTPNGSAYNIPVALRVQGALDIGVLRRSLAEIVRRHEALRTVFAAHDGTPVQAIEPPSDPALLVVDLSGLEEGHREWLSHELAGQEAGRPFDLSRGPLLRAVVVHLAEASHLALLTMHHIVSDGWSMGILVREVSALYQAYAAQRPSPLSELPVQYADYAVWQRSWLQGEVLENELVYWRRQLAGLPPLLELPTDRPRPQVQSFRGAAREVRLSPALTRQVRALARREGATVFMAILAAFQALLARYSGQHDLAVGTPIAGRNRLETEELIGFFVNTLVLRGNVAPGRSFGELLRRLLETALAAHMHQDVPFEKLVEELTPERNLAYSPLFQVMFVLQNAPQESLEMGELRVRSIGAAIAFTKFDLTLTLAETDDLLDGFLGFSTDLFDAPTIDRLLRHFEQLFTAALDAVSAPVEELPLLSQAESRQLLIEWNALQPPFAVPALGVHEIFEQRTAELADRVAVVHGGEQLSFAALNGLANRLAGRLRRSGVGTESYVALVMERGVEVVIGLLAALKAGAAFVIVDPAQPASRLAQTLADAAPKAVLTRGAAAASLSLHGAAVFRLDGPLDDSESGEDLGLPVVPGQLAYGIYTSGSTGAPKCVVLRHDAVVNLLLALEREIYAGAAPDLRVAVNTSLHFDGSMKQIIQLLSGRSLDIVPEEIRTDPEVLRAHLAAHQLDVLDCTPSQLRALLEAGLGRDGEVAPGRVLVGGEAIEAPLWERLSALAGTRFFNVYGPSECTVDTTVRRITPDAPRPVLGRPIANVGVQVLGPASMPVPGGVPGELCVSGAGLARGYLGRPELTAERFVPDFWGGVPGARLYRTGDLVRWTAGGELEYLGRIDHQVKVRGFRIELGEIEAALARLAGVREAVVVTREEVSGDRRLVAYVVGAPEGGAWREQLAKRLPEYMVPSALVMLEAMPLTPNGKVDRRALPAPEWRPAEGHLAPRTTVEELLAGIWSEVLGVERPGVEDNFFELGGHSLLATRVMSRLRSAFQVELPLRELFEEPTLAGLAVRVESALRVGAGLLAPPLVPLAPVERQGALPLSFAQQRLWFLDQFAPNGSAYNLPVALRVQGALDVGVLRRSLEEIERRHEALRTVFIAHEGELAQVIKPALEFVLPVVDLSGLAEGQRERLGSELVGQDAARPFDLARGPLLRARVVRMAEHDHFVLLTMHHILSDGWSMEILVREVTALYVSLTRGTPVSLPELPVQYADYAVWQRSWLQGEVLAREIHHWRGRLAGAPPLLELPADRPRPAVQSQRGAGHTFRLPDPLSERLRALSRQRGSTLFMTLLAGFQALLARSTGQPIILVSTPVAGRNHLALEGLIGFFVNMLVLRADVAGELSFADLLAQVRETVLAAHAHQDLPFEKLVEELEPERSLSHAPLAQVTFLLQNRPRAELAIENLRLDAVETSTATAKLDLTLALTETGSGFAGALEYSTDLFDGSTVARLAERYRSLLEDAVAQPGRPVADLAQLAGGERHQVLWEWRGGAEAPPPGLPVHALFEEQAALRPAEPALVWDGGSLSYGELDRRADALADHLRGLGVGPEVAVAFCLERSPELVVTTLAILKAGGAYVPLDPGAPAEWLAWVLSDVQAPVLVTRRTLRDRVPESSAYVVLLDELPATAATAAPARRSDQTGRTGGDSLAYVMYTSGSTGRPKGVAVVHRAVVRLIRGEFARFGPGETWLQLAPVWFDAATLEIWGALANGAQLAIPPAGALSLAEIGEALGRFGVTTLWLTAGLFRQMVDERPADLGGLRQLLAGGDVLSPAHVRRWLEMVPGGVLINGYGPTENTTFTACGPLAGGGEVGWTVPLGRPITHTRVRILDGALAPVPVGVAGELFAGGEGLARCYLGRPELTAERFIPDPLGEPGARLYRTGDRARWLADGRLDFLGRVDRQVKIRGFRVEPGEVEAVLGRHPAVREAAVVVREDRTGDRRLAAFVVPATSSRQLTEELLDHLRQVLPPYLVPSSLVVLPELPLNSNGKVDRGALLAMRADLTSHGAEEEQGLLTAAEAVMAEIWAEVLGLEQVSPDASFFDLGGHSLLATQVISRVRKVFEVELPMSAVFEDDNVRALAARVDDIRRAERGVRLPDITPADRSDRTLVIPLSFAQQRLWFLDQLVPNSSTYNVPVAWHLSGRLRLSSLAASLTEVVRRHETLRTTFHPSSAGPFQEIAPPAPVSVPVVDLRALAPVVRDAEAARLMAAEARRPFDLRRGPLLRSTLLYLEREQALALLTLHHIISDGWSLGVLGREVSTLEEVFAQGLPSPLPELPIQYADFAIWQRRVFSEGALATEVEYWREQLRGAPPIADLPLDHPRPKDLADDGAVLAHTLPVGLSAALRAFGRRQGATSFITLLAGFQALLGRYAAEPDVVVGTPVAGRTHLEIEGLIGFFVNTLVLRTRMEDGPCFEELVRRVRHTTLEAHAHQDVPFEELVEKLQPERSLAVSPLFQVMFDVKTYTGWRAGLQGLRATMAGVASQTAKFDLNLNVLDLKDGLHLALEYRADLFDATTAWRLLNHLERLLQGAIADPGGRLPELPLLSEAERAQLLEWNDTRRSYILERCLHELVEEQARLAPDQTAIVWRDGAVSYGELERRANRLAHELRDLGIGPEDRVGLMLRRSPAMVVGILGILKAGGAYVPLDPSYPDERLAYMIDDAELSVVVTETGASSVAQASGATVLDLDRERQRIARRSEEAPAPRAVAGNLAYVIYTSGSTGRPKGVMVPHRGVANRLLWAQEVYRLDEQDAVLQKASFSFDFSVWECFAPLLAGARLVLAEPGRQGDGAYLIRTIQEHGVTFVHFVPSMLAVFLAEEGVEECVSLRQVFSGGEALTPELRDRALMRLPAPLDNQYGPTEISIDTTRWVCAPGPDPYRLPVGHPIANSRLYVVDRELRPVAVGLHGELLVGGTGVTRGYLRRPDLTAERFVPDPFAEEAGARLYRTGDLARRLTDGTVEFRGRVDHQVKLRGFRIELGEIESTLAEYPLVRDAVAIVREDVPGDPRLVAYLVADEGAAPRAPELRGFLQELLPEYMIPSAFVVLEAFPRTPAGKVDRRALPAPERTLAQSSALYVAPRTPLEGVLAQVWAELLQAERVGIHDNFFELGGHSLLATQVVSRVRSLLGIEVPLRALFERPTLSGFAYIVESARRSLGGSQMPPLQRVDRSLDLPLSFAQQRLWFLDQLAPGGGAYNVPVALRVEGDLHVGVLQCSLTEIVRRHEALRTVFAAHDGTPVQIVEPPYELALPVVDLSGLEEGRRERLGSELLGREARRPFHLSRGPLLRALVVRLSAEEHLALVTIHHIVSDGWSIGILVREVSMLYASLSARMDSPLPELPVQYADYAVWQRSWLQGEVLAQDIDYWRRQLAGAPALLELPTDRPRPAVQSSRGAAWVFPLPVELSAGLQSLSRRRGATLFMTLLAGFQMLLARYTGQQDVVVGTPIAGRNHVELEGLIGFFINTLILRTDLRGEPGFEDLLGRVRETVLSAHTHQEVPFEKLVEELEPERSLAYSPLFQVLFALQNVPQEELSIRDLRLRPLDSPATTAKFDLAMALSEAEGEVRGLVEYNTDLFDEVTIERLARHFERLLSAVVEAPSSPVGGLALLSAAELSQLTEWSSGTGDSQRVGICLGELFEAQVDRTPEAVALVWGEEELRYAELAERSNRLAHYLRRLGVGPERVVGICLERTAELVVAVLGVLKAGGAYLPLDPAYPAQRLSWMLEESAAPVVVTEQRLLASLPPEARRVVCLDAEQAALSAESASRPRPWAVPQNLAYVIYTSGSTGRPKGVAISHRSASLLVQWAGETFGAEELSGVLASTSLSFDLSVFELFMPLSWGGTVILAPNVLHLPALPAAARVRLINTVPSALAELVRAESLPPGVKTVNLAGEPLARGLAQQILASGTVERLWNLYGPSEDTTYSTAAQVEPGEEEASIGRPIPGGQSWVVDGGLRPVPVGVAGELLLGG
ncbi:MAG TPA: non-ribosomal peptide synthase/polyketide synthase, partial [Thermoanaerobaculia bacterium]|nr:non-ribosomal peptide synthase/polyketide synthase [Thermoanaerobaculia bacterium]